MKHAWMLSAVLLTALCTAHGSPLSSDTPRSEQSLHLDLIQRMQGQGSWYASLAHINAYRQNYGNPPMLRLIEADAFRQIGQHDQARALYGQLLKSPHRAAALNGLGLIDAATGNLSAAIVQLQQASSLSPLNASYLGDLGYALLLTGDWLQAELPLSQAIELTAGEKRAVANFALLKAITLGEAQARAILSQGGFPPEAQDTILHQAATLKSARLSLKQPAALTPGEAPAPSDAPVPDNLAAAPPGTPAATEAAVPQATSLVVQPPAPQKPPSSPDSKKTPSAPASSEGNGTPLLHTPLLERFASTAPSSLRGSQP